MKYKLYIDFDTILYRYCKFLQEDTIEVEYKNNGKKKGFKNLTEFKGRKKTKVEGWLGEINKGREEPFLLQDFSITPVSKIIHPDTYAYKYLKGYVENLHTLSWVEEVKILLGGKGNFRDDIYKDYKAQRGPKPLRLLDIKEWFVNEYKELITLSDNCEADDLLSIIMWWGWKKDGRDSNIVGGHIDKDCNTVPGKHWDYDKQGDIYEVDEFTAHHNLAIQCIIGDGIDNIPSVPKANQCVQDRYAIGKGGIGPTKAKKILAGCDTIEALYREIEELYMCYHQEEYKEPLNLVYRLVHLQEKMGEVKDFPFSL